jgi:triacylglycerol lipase
VAHAQFHVAPGSGLKGAIMTSGGGFEIARPSVYWADASKLGEMASLPGLIKTSVPLFITHAEFDPPEIYDAGERLDKALCAAGKCPAVFLTSKGHNHMSQVYTIGTMEHQISDPVLAFIRRYGQ